MGLLGCELIVSWGASEYLNMELNDRYTREHKTKCIKWWKHWFIYTKLLLLYLFIISVCPFPQGICSSWALVDILMRQDPNESSCLPEALFISGWREVWAAPGMPSLCGH